MNTAWKYWAVGVALLVWWALAWLGGAWLDLSGRDLWTLRGGLGVIGLAAFFTAVWWFSRIDADRLARGEITAAGADEIDSLTLRAQARLFAAAAVKPGFAELPAVLVLGESGSAKTSTVCRSGVEAQLLAGHALRNDSTVPTHSVNLWFAAPFVIAEAGAQLLDDPPRWARLVRKFAPGGFPGAAKGPAQPRLALLCIDCEKLLAAGATTALGARIDQWRARLREAAQVLGINLPVYVLFTHADRVQYFQDFTSALNDDEATQVLGASLPTAAYAAESYAEAETAASSAAFDDLAQSLAERRLPLLARNFDRTTAPPVYEFPREFRKLRSMVVSLLTEVCRPIAGQTTPFLRGFYFSGTRSIIVAGSSASSKEDLLAQAGRGGGSLNATYVLDVKSAGGQGLAANEPRRISQWLFLSQLFKDVMFQDGSALATSTLSTRAGLGKRILLGAAMGLLLVVALAFAISSIANKRMENQVATAVQDVGDIRQTARQLPTLDGLTKLETLRQSLETLTQNHRQGPPLMMGFGLYVGETLLPDARLVYFQHFEEMLFNQAQANLLNTLASLPESPGANNRYGPAFDALKAYLMTTDQPAKSDADFLSHELLQAWAGNRDIDAARRQLAQKQFDFYCSQLKTENPFPREPDTHTVAHARHYLAQLPGDEHVYQSILQAAAKSNPPVSFNSQFPGSEDVLADSTEVGGAFTKAGWNFVQNAMANPGPYFSADSWVVLGLDDSIPSDLSKRAGELRRKYQAEYVGRWQSFLANAAINHPVSLGIGVQELQRLSGDRSPLLALFCVAAQNTAVNQQDVAGLFQPVQWVAPSDCVDQSVGPATSAYVKSLSDLQACADRADTTPEAQKDAAKAECRRNVTEAEEAVARIAAKFQAPPDAHTDMTVKNLLLDPINDMALLLKPGPVSAAPLCAQMSPLESLFPFNADADREVSLQQLRLVYAPERGALSQFYATALKGLLVPGRGQFVPNPDSLQKVSAAFLSFFNRAMAVQRTLYAGGSGAAQFHYALRPIATENVATLALSIDGASLTFSGADAQFTQFSWPGTASQGVQLRVRIPGGTELGFPAYEGVWGTFRFFNDATVLQHNGNYTVLQWVLGGSRPVTAPNGKTVTVQFDLDTKGALPIVEKGMLSDLRCVPAVTE